MVCPLGIPRANDLFEAFKALKQGLGAGHAARDIHIYGQVIIEPFDSVVTIKIHAAINGVTAQPHHIFRALHLLIGPNGAFEGFDAEIVRNDKQIGLPRGRPPFTVIPPPENSAITKATPAPTASVKSESEPFSRIQNRKRNANISVFCRVVLRLSVEKCFINDRIEDKFCPRMDLRQTLR